jgi:hypothetical protein
MGAASTPDGRVSGKRCGNRNVPSHLEDGLRSGGGRAARRALAQAASAAGAFGAGRRWGHARVTEGALTAAVRARLVEHRVQAFRERYSATAERTSGAFGEQWGWPVQHRRRHETLRQTPTTRPTMSTSRA